MNETKPETQLAAKQYMVIVALEDGHRIVYDADDYSPYRVYFPGNRITLGLGGRLICSDRSTSTLWGAKVEIRRHRRRVRKLERLQRKGM